MISKVNANFADDTFSLFSVVHDTDTSANDLYHDLEKISEWGFQWKMKFNPDPTKEAQVVIFSKKKTLFLSTQLFILITLP